MPGHLEQHLAVRPAASLVGFANVLELTSAQLAEWVGRACAENPALERDDVPLCRCCGERLRGARCWSCDWSWRGSRPAPLVETAGGDHSDVADLVADLRAHLPTRDAPVAEYLVFNLSPRGLLEVDEADAAAALGATPARVRRVLDALRELGPAGIAARSARECLLLQLDRWERDNAEARPLVRVVIDRHLADLAAGRIRLIAEATGTHDNEIRDAYAFVRAHLRPFPAIDLSPGGGVIRLLPDVAFHRKPAGYGVELLEPHRLRLRVRELGPGGQGWVRDARLLVSRIEQRWRTLRQVCQFLGTTQRGFLDHGPDRLVPLTRAATARALGVHESTVSRCVAGRHAVLPGGRVVPLATFFPTAPGVREALRRLVRDAGPRTDRELAARLGELGFRVARRTVAKYRSQLGIPAGAGR